MLGCRAASTILPRLGSHVLEVRGVVDGAAVAAAVAVAALPAGTICFGEQVTFTATPSSAGANPTYQWTVNGTNAGTGDTFSSSTLNDGDVVAVTLTSSSPCANPTTATSTAR